MCALTITYDELRRYIGRFLGYTRKESELNADKIWTQDVDDILKSGLREFYYYRAAEGIDPGHVWSFLMKDASLSVISGDRDIVLPSDFSTMVDGFVYGYGIDKTALAAISQREIQTLYAKSDVSGNPLYYSIKASSDGTAHSVSIYPKADGSYTLPYRYSFEAPSISDAVQSPLGGALHAETILESCLAAAEKQMNPEGGPGIHHGKFLEFLKSSIEMDRQYNMADAVGGIWPLDSVDGAVTDLAINKAYLMRLIGRKLGHGENDSLWDHRKTSEVHEVLRQGLRGFYTPVILPGETYAWQWSFLCPTGNMTFESGVDTYPLPEDFAMMNGPMTYRPGTATLYPPVRIVGESKVRRYMQSVQYTGKPTMAAVRVRDGSPESGTRFELIVHPTPDQDWPVVYPYRSNPMLVSRKTDLPLGGQPHAQTLIESCMYAADTFRGEASRHEKKFMECLRASVSYDREHESPPHLGYNRDTSDYMNGARDWHDMDENIVNLFYADGSEYTV